MCLYINQKVHTDPKKAFIARTDIVVWKILRVKHGLEFEYYGETPCSTVSYHAPYRWFTYELGKLYLEPRMKVDRHITVEAGLHSCKSLRAANRRNDDIFGTVFPAIIPKGSRVFIGKGGDIASNKLIVYKSKQDLEKVHGKIQKRITMEEGLR